MEGNIDAGEAAYNRFRCGVCHEVVGREDLRNDIDPIMTVTLGGKTTLVRTYGELVTSVINPLHRISQQYLEEPVDFNGVSRMWNYNDVMTVSEMANIVTFLQEQYDLEPYTPSAYPGYSIP